MSDDDREVNLLDYLYVVVVWRKVIFWTVGVSMAVAVVLLFIILPRWYKSTAVIMPPKQSNQFSVSAMLKNIAPLGGLGLGKASEEMYNFLAILESRTCFEEIVRRFDLVPRYGVKNVERAIKELEDNTDFALGQDDVVLEVSTYDTDPVRAAEMANAFIDVLNKQYLDLMTTEARSNRKFLEGRLEKNQMDLTRAEEELRDYQKKHGVYSIPEQTKALVQAAAAMKSQLLAKEVEYGILRKKMEEDNPLMESLKLEINEFSKKLRELENGGGMARTQADIFPPFEQTPELAMQYLRRYREVEIQQKLMELLLPLVEQAKIEEHRDTPTILVVDKGVPAEKPSRPKRMIITIAVFLGSIVISILLVFLLSFFQRTRAELELTTNEKLKHLTSQLDWKTFFFFSRRSENKPRHPEG